VDICAKAVEPETIALRCCYIENQYLRDFIKERVFTTVEAIWPKEKDKILYQVSYRGGDSVYVSATDFSGPTGIPMMFYESYPGRPVFITMIDSRDVVVKLRSMDSSLFRIGSGMRYVTGSSELMLNDCKIEWFVCFNEGKITDVWSDYEYLEFVPKDLLPAMYLLPNKSIRYYRNKNIDWKKALIQTSEKSISLP